MSTPAEHERFETPSPDTEGEEVATIRTSGLSREQVDAFMAWSDDAFGEDVCVEGSRDENGRTTLTIRLMPEEDDKES